jgi:hypothetical protein
MQRDHVGGVRAVRAPARFTVQKPVYDEVGQHAAHGAIAAAAFRRQPRLRRPTQAVFVCVIGQHQQHRLVARAAHGLTQGPSDRLHAHAISPAHPAADR